jgi:hypothetical protein
MTDRTEPGPVRRRNSPADRRNPGPGPAGCAAGRGTSGGIELGAEGAA